MEKFMALLVLGLLFSPFLIGMFTLEPKKTVDQDEIGPNIGVG